MTDWAEIIKSLLSDGELTFGFTIWSIMIFITAFAFILYSVGTYRRAFGRDRLARIFLSRVSPGRRVRFKLYGMKFSDASLLSAVKGGVIEGLNDFDIELYELEDGD